jgi:hypothetical protein
MQENRILYCQDKLLMIEFLNAHLIWFPRLESLKEVLKDLRVHWEIISHLVNRVWFNKNVKFINNSYLDW